MFLCLAVADATSPHQIFNFTWVINEPRDVAFATSHMGASPPWPVLTPDLCKLASGRNPYWGLPDKYLPLDKAPHRSGFNEHLVGCDTVH